MKPIRTPSTNLTLKSDEDGIEPLPVERIGSVHLSTWELSDEDRTLIAEGGRVELAVYGILPPMRFPPVSLLVSPPYCDACGERMLWSPELQTWSCPHEEAADGEAVGDED